MANIWVYKIRCAKLADVKTLDRKYTSVYGEYYKAFIVEYFFLL